MTSRETKQESNRRNPGMLCSEPERIHLVENPIAVTRAVESLVHEFRTIHESLKIYAGEAYWPIFDDPECALAIRQLAKRGINIKVVAGPVLSRGGGENSPQILELAEQRVVELYCRTTRGNKSHFRISDNQEATTQPSHEPLTPLANRGKLVTIQATDPRFSGIRKEFDRWAVDEFRATKPRKDFLVLRSHQLQSAFRLAKERGEDYNQLKRDQIEELVGQLS